MAENLILLRKEELVDAFKDVLLSFFRDFKNVSPTINEEYYTRGEACYRLHITFTTLWRLEKRGMIKVHKVGRRSLYAKSDVDALISSGTQKDVSNI